MAKEDHASSSLYEEETGEAKKDAELLAYFYIYIVFSAFPIAFMPPLF